MVMTRSRSKSSDIDTSEIEAKPTTKQTKSPKNKQTKVNSPKSKNNQENGSSTPSKKGQSKNTSLKSVSSNGDQELEPIVEQVNESIADSNTKTQKSKSESAGKSPNNSSNGKSKQKQLNGNIQKESLSSLTEKILSNPLAQPVSDSHTNDPHLQLMTKVLELGKSTQFGKDGPFEQIRMKGLNMEQIWGQMNLKNNVFLDRAETSIKNWYGVDAMDVEDEMDLDDEDDEDMLDDLEDDEDEDEDEEDDDDDEDDEQYDDEEEFKGFDEEEEEDAMDVDDEQTLKAPKRTYEVDDQFFSLEQMEDFVQEAERNEMKEDEDEDEEDDEDDLDLFADPDELDDSDAEADINDVKFSDFFLPTAPKKPISRSKLSFKKGVDDQDEKASEDEMEVDEEDEAEEDEMEVDEEDEEDEEEIEPSSNIKKTSNLFDDDDDIMVDEEGVPLSSFEQKQAKMSEIIHELEMENIDDKAWTMKGEATGKNRPLNSLLEEDLEFDYASKPAPLITEEVTQSLEEVIKQRILESQFDDVEKKVAPKIREYQPREQLDQEKSLKSLGEVYEDEYQTQVAGLPAKQQEKLTKAHQDIEELFDRVMSKLTSLSNFHYTPKAPQLKVQVVENVGAIQMEEALPTAVSDAQTLAPEEVYEKPRGEVMTKEEMDPEEKKRLRNRKKRLAKLRSKDKPDPKDKVDPMIASLPKV